MLIPNKFNGYSRDGRRIYFFDTGGGGGGGSPAATTTTATQDLPDWAKGPAQDVLAKGTALTDINQNPYQAYGGNRIAGFTDLQNQSFANAKNMSVAPQIGQGSTLAAGAGLGGVNVAGQANTQGFQNQMGGYMNPYMNQILAPQLAEANRNYDIGATKQQSAATQAGAFGGSREAIMAAENERNRNTGLNQIYGQGMNNAYNQAQQQYNQNLQNQLAGYGLASQAAGQLGQLGQTQYQQNMGITGLQNQYGVQQQQQNQQALSQAYNDFLTQKNYPYQQLSYMSNLIRGTPMGMNTASQVYQAPPSTAQNLTALGMGAYGAKQLFSAKGGLMESYADGGSVTSEQNVKSIANFLPKEQVPKSLQMAQQRNDLDAQLALQKQMAENASLQRGLGSAFNALPPETQDGVVRAAGGGILAFDEGGSANEAPDLASMFATRVADPKLQAQLSARQLALIDSLSNQQRVQPGTKDDRMKFQNEYIAEAQKAAGPAPYADLNKNIEGQYAGISAERKLDDAAAAFEAIPAILEGNNALRGIAGGVAKFGGGIAKAAKNERLGRANLSEAQFKLKDAERKERMGLHHESRVAYDAGQKLLIEADKNATAAKNALGNTIAKTMAANKISGSAGGAGGKEKEWEFATKKYLPLIQSNAETKDLPRDQQEALAYDMYQKGKTPGYQGVTAKAEATDQLKAREDFNNAKIMKSKEYRAAKGDPAKIAELDRQNAAAAGYKLPASHPAMQGANTPAPAPIQAPANLNTFLDAARKANPGVSDADLTAYYNTKYKK